MCVRVSAVSSAVTQLDAALLHRRERERKSCVFTLCLCVITCGKYYQSSLSLHFCVLLVLYVIYVVCLRGE